MKHVKIRLELRSPEHCWTNRSHSVRSVRSTQTMHGPPGWSQALNVFLPRISGPFETKIVMFYTENIPIYIVVSLIV